jgi:hypothetical protein
VQRKKIGEQQTASYDLSAWVATIHPRYAEFGVVLLIWGLSRIVFYVSGVWGTWLLPEMTAEPARVVPNARLLLALHWRWDAIHYYTLATDGYGDNPLTAYFPILPLLINAGSRLLNGFRAPLPLPIDQAETAPLIAGVLIAHVAALLAFWLLFQLARDETDTPTAHRTVLYAALFPLGLYYAVPYTEALFLAASVGAFLAARRRQWIAAGVWIAIASGTRLVGVLLVPAIALEMLLLWLRGEWQPREWLRMAAGLAIAPLGLLLFMLFLWQRTGDPLAFVNAQAAWSHERLFPLTTLLRGINYALQPGLSAAPDLYARGVFHTLIVIGFLAILVVSVRWWRPGYVLYGLLLFAIVLSSPLPAERTMHSLGRYLMILFPVYISLARWGNNPLVHHAILGIWLPLFGIMTALYVRWYAVA